MLIFRELTAEGPPDHRAAIQKCERHNTSGFSMTEILVVVGIIALVTALCLPIFVGAKRAAKSVSCLSNLRELGAATQLYQQDYDGKTPGTPFYWAERTNESINPLRTY